MAITRNRTFANLENATCSNVSNEFQEIQKPYNHIVHAPPDESFLLTLEEFNHIARASPEESFLATLKEFQEISPAFNLPKKAKSINTLTFKKQIERKSAHPMCLVTKPSGSLHFFKYHKKGSLITQSEALSAAVCQFLAPECVSSVRPVFEENTYQFVGVISKAIADFKS